MCRSEGSGRARAARAGAGPPGGRGAQDAGFVTAEAAVVLPVLVAVAAALIWGLLAACARIGCVDAARAAARAAARQEPAAQVLAAARGAAPRGARITVAREGDLVRVRVEAALPGGARLPVRVGGEAVALAEETVR